MGKALYDRYDTARRTFEEASDTIGYSVSKLCFDGTKEDLTRTDRAQPCILTVSMAAFRVLNEHMELEPFYYAGHSLGEFSALAASGALGFADAVRLVTARGRLMHESQLQGEGGMIAVHGLEVPMLEEECARPEYRGAAVVSNLNLAGQTVISGRRASLAGLKERLASHGADIVELQVGAAFHSPLMKEASIRFKDELSRVSFGPMRGSVLSNVTARPYPDSGSIPALLAEQMVSVVDWRGCMQYLFARETRRMIEAGPGATLGNMLRRDPSTSCLLASTDREADWRSLVGDGKRPPREADIGRMLKEALCARNDNHNDSASEYKQRISAPFAELKRLAQLEREGAALPSEAEHIALQALEQVLDAKMTPSAQRQEIMNRLVQEGGIRLHVQYA
ncbi:ACP S-malonyltransferase [Paenibacillus sp. RUD330]|uniref:ACP S-malonyltransferase n=2 Tax=Paenibacillus TaxID=44249 RepID=UPI0012FDB70A|nr:ACP S-malonyltransferase [Paenibacillus sp. RUD330]ASS65419.2 ACP S-malonyltransferase [Paenibacillus sp. RUD330]